MPGAAHAREAQSADAVPLDAALVTKIQHVVFIIKENHTFDNYFGTYSSPSGRPVNGQTFAQFPADKPQCPPMGRIGHDRWLIRDSIAVKEQFTRAHIPAYFSYADQFTLCDNFFTAEAGPSWPNHFMFMTADSPIVDNINIAFRFPLGTGTIAMDSLPIKAGNKNLAWKLYYGEAGKLLDYPIFKWETALNAIQTGPQRGAHIALPDQFDIDCKSGALPSVAWLYGEGETSEHPPLNAGDAAGDVLRGSNWTADRITALVNGKDPLTGKSYWENTVIFVTWDDWGGWYDHVDSPNDQNWSVPRGVQPIFRNTQFRRGSRVGCLVLSPYARMSYISTAFHTQVSLVRFCVELFGLVPFGTPAYLQADNMADCFNASQAALAPPTYASPDRPPLRTKGAPSLEDLIDGE